MAHGKRKKRKKAPASKRFDKVRRNRVKSNDRVQKTSGKRVGRSDTKSKATKRASKVLDKVKGKKRPNAGANRFNGTGNKKKARASEKSKAKGKKKSEREIAFSAWLLNEFERKAAASGKPRRKKKKEVSQPGEYKTVNLLDVVKDKSEIKKKYKDKTERQLRDKKAYNNKAVRGIQDFLNKKQYNGKSISELVIEQRDLEEKKQPIKKISFEGRMMNPKTIRDILYKRIFEYNNESEIANEKIEKQFKKEVKRKGKLTYKDLTKNIEGFTKPRFRSWQMKDVLEEIFVKRKLKYFNGINLSTHANDASYTIDNIFLGMGKYDVFILIINTDKDSPQYLYSRYEIELNGYYRK